MTNEARQHIQDIDKQDEQDLEEKASNLKVDPNYFRKATGNQGQVKVAHGNMCSQHQKKIWIILAVVIVIVIIIILAMVASFMTGLCLSYTGCKA
jgi:hypothetical protein